MTKRTGKTNNEMEHEPKEIIIINSVYGCFYKTCDRVSSFRFWEN